MGCHHYYLSDANGPIVFSEADDTVGCLCTFPHNDQGVLTPERVRSLAYLGAAVVLMARGNLEHGYLPECLPEWIRKGIDSQFPPEG